MSFRQGLRRLQDFLYPKRKVSHVSKNASVDGLKSCSIVDYFKRKAEEESRTTFLSDFESDLKIESESIIVPVEIEKENAIPPGTYNSASQSKPEPEYEPENRSQLVVGTTDTIAALTSDESILVVSTNSIKEVRELAENAEYDEDERRCVVEEVIVNMETNIHNVITINWKEVVKCHGRKFVKISNKREAARTTEGLRGCWNRTKKEMFPNDTDNATLQANFIEKFNLPTGPTNKTTHPKTPEKKLGSDAPLTKQDGMVFQQHVDKKFLGIERLLTAQKRQQSVESDTDEEVSESGFDEARVYFLDLVSKRAALTYAVELVDSASDREAHLLDEIAKLNESRANLKECFAAANARIAYLEANIRDRAQFYEGDLEAERAKLVEVCDTELQLSAQIDRLMELREVDYKKTNQFREKFAYIKNELLAVQGALEYFLSGELMGKQDLSVTLHYVKELVALLDKKEMLPIIPVLESIVVYSEEDAKVVKFGVPQSFFQKFSAVITDMAGSELFAKVASWSSTDV